MVVEEEDSCVSQRSCPVLSVSHFSSRGHGWKTQETSTKDQWVDVVYFQRPCQEKWVSDRTGIFITERKKTRRRKATANQGNDNFLISPQRQRLWKLSTVSLSFAVAFLGDVCCLSCNNCRRPSWPLLWRMMVDGERIHQALLIAPLAWWLIFFHRPPILPTRPLGCWEVRRG